MAAGIAVPLGLALEIVPEVDPLSLRPGDELEVRLLWQGRPLEGARLKAFRDGAASAYTVTRTDARGRARIALDRPGLWLLTAIHMQSAADGSEADWRSTWSSLTFEVSSSPVFSGAAPTSR